jgi:tetratricopeptide (TPR) repeat protein
MPIVDLAFEHRMYLPSAAVMAAVALGCCVLWRRWIEGQPGDAGRLSWVPTALIVVAVLALGVQTALRNEIYRSPVAIYQDAVENYPRSARAHMGLAVACNLVGNPGAGLEQIDLALALNPALLNAHGVRGILLARLDRTDEALAEFAVEERTNPSNAAVFESRGKLYFRQGNFAAAAADYGRQLELAPNHGSAYANRALCYLELGKYDLAIGDCDRALALDPWQANAYCYRGNCYAALGQPQRAIDELDAALRLDARLAIAYRDRAAAHISLGRLAAARADLASFLAAGGRTDAEFERLSALAKTADSAADR